MSEKIGQMHVYVDDRKIFTSIAKLNGKTQAELLREMIKKYIETKKTKES